jgi:hypothetical protein
MRKTIYLPDALAAQVEEYLATHRDETLSSLIQKALKEKVAPKDGGSILDLIGFVSVDPDTADEDIEGRLEDSTVNWYDGPPR